MVDELEDKDPNKVSQEQERINEILKNVQQEVKPIVDADRKSEEMARSLSVSDYSARADGQGRITLTPNEAAEFVKRYNEQNEREKRAHWIGAPEFYHLNSLCAILEEAFGPNNYLVGSSLKRRDYRDVDVRCMIDDDEFERIFPDAKGSNHYLGDARWSLVCAAISEWLSKRSGLPIDFQLQRQSEANEKFASAEGHPRCAIGVFVHIEKEKKT